MTTWFTADLHFGHANIIGYTGRPYATTDEMDEDLIRRWNTTVGADDVAWVVGDFALGPIATSLPLAGRLQGHKILVAGNHDRCWAGHGARAEGWVERYLDAGFAEVRQGPVEITIAGRPALADHFPYAGDSHDEDRFAGFRPVDRGDWLIHGHVHTTWRQSKRMVNVGVDAWGGAPVSEDRLAEVMAAGPDQLAPVGWELET